MRYCYSLTGDLLHRIPELAKAEHTGFEIRLDSLHSPPDAVAIRQSTQRNLLGTYRSKHHLGQADRETRDTQGWQWRCACLDAGFEMIDLELDENDLDTKIKHVQARGAKVVLSHHDLSDGAGLDEALEAALATEADIIKIISTGTGTGDVVRQRQYYARASGRPLVHFAMGAELAATRVLCLLLGSPFTFITADASNAVAPGQLTLPQLNDIFRPLEVKPEAARLFAVIGTPIAHSRSPIFHNHLLKEVDANAMFVALPAASAQDLADLLEHVPELAGMAVTKPMKEAAFARADHFLDGVTQNLGAANTLIRKESKLGGANTDLLAMLELLQAESNASVLVLGYGGLGKAVVAACQSIGLDVTVTNRTAGRVDDPSIREMPWANRHDDGPTVIVQATSAGMAPKVELTPMDRFPSTAKHLIETIYNPSETRIMKMASEAGLRVTNGHALFEGQARIQNGFFRDILT